MNNVRIERHDGQHIDPEAPEGRTEQLHVPRSRVSTLDIQKDTSRVVQNGVADARLLLGEALGDQSVRTVDLTGGQGETGFQPKLTFHKECFVKFAVLGMTGTSRAHRRRRGSRRSRDMRISHRRLLFLIIRQALDRTIHTPPALIIR